MSHSVGRGVEEKKTYFFVAALLKNSLNNFVGKLKNTHTIACTHRPFHWFLFYGNNLNFSQVGQEWTGLRARTCFCLFFLCV